MLWYSLEAPLQDASNEYPQYKFYGEIKKKKLEKYYMESCGCSMGAFFKLITSLFSTPLG